MNITDVNPALRGIATLAGTWEMTLSNASFLPDPKTTLTGTAKFEWFDEGDFLILRQGVKGTPPWATWFIGRDKDSNSYTMLYFDDKKSSRIYGMNFESGIWDIWRDAEGFSQRFTGKLSQDEKTITGYWEKSTDGTTWSRDFDLEYKKL